MRCSCRLMCSPSIIIHIVHIWMHKISKILLMSYVYDTRIWSDISNQKKQKQQNNNNQNKFIQFQSSCCCGCSYHLCMVHCVTKTNFKKYTYVLSFHFFFCFCGEQKIGFERNFFDVVFCIFSWLLPKITYGQWAIVGCKE